MSQLTAAILSICLSVGSSSPISDPHWEHRWGYVDTTGKEVIAPKYLRAGKFNHGFAKCAGVGNNGLLDWRTKIFVDRKGNEFKTSKELPATKRGEQTVTFQIDDQSITQDTDFVLLNERNGLKLVRTPYQFFVLQNKKLIEIPNTKISPYGINPKTGNMWFRKGNEFLEFTGEVGKSEIPGIEPADSPEFIEAHFGVPSRLSDKYLYWGEFSDGLLPAWTKEKHWQYVDKNGNVKITLPDDCCAAHPFSEGLAAVALGGRPWVNSGGHSQISSFNGAKFGFIDTNGKFVIPPKFPCPDKEWTSSFKNGLALATAEKNATTVYGYINRQGEFVVPAKYSELAEFNEGLAAFDSHEPGFDPLRWASKRDRDRLMTQLLRQYDILSMKKEHVIKLLGLPDSTDTDPNAEKYLLSSTCLGSSWFAIRYDLNGKVYGYNCTYGGMIGPGTNYVPKSDWIVTAQKPNADEYFGEFFASTKKETYVPGFVKPVSDKFIQDVSYHAFNCPVGQVSFDSDVWKSFPDKRRYMLFSLFHKRGLDKKSVEECEKLLGPTERSEKIPASFSPQELTVRYYKLNLPQYDSAEVALRFIGGRLSSVGFCVNEEDGISHEYSTPWVVADPKPENTAKEMNKYFALVGMPVEVAHYKGFRLPCRESATYPIELAVTRDKNHIEKIRVNYEAMNLSGYGKFSPWESTNYYPEADIAYPQVLGHGLEYYLYVPGVLFSEKYWKDKCQRHWVLFDVVHSKKIIGKKRADVHLLLGQPDTLQGKPEAVDNVNIVESDPGDAMTADCEWYLMNVDGTDHDSFFQISYRNDVAVGYRLSTEPKEKTIHFSRTMEIINGLNCDYSWVRKLMAPLLSGVKQ